MPSLSAPFTFYEFFAGGGLARLGLGPTWRCLFANDIDPMKCAAYGANFGDQALVEADIGALSTAQLPGRADLAWASFPCQDLSLAGRRGGLAAARSGTFFAFWSLMKRLKSEDRAPRLIVIENVVGLLTSNRGRDFNALADLIAAEGYVFGAHVVDAARFVPQSRPRLFIVAYADESAARGAVGLSGDAPDSREFTFTPQLEHAIGGLASEARRAFRRCALAPPPKRNHDLIDCLEPDDCAAWFDAERVAALLAQMAPAHRAKLEALAAAGGRHAGAVFRRMRTEQGRKIQRAEIRFDGLAGCLRTPGGGSSRQILLLVSDGDIRARLLSPRECARLMGVDDAYRLPRAATSAYHVLGDGVVAPVARWLAQELMERRLITGRKAA